MYKLIQLCRNENTAQHFNGSEVLILKTVSEHTGDNFKRYSTCSQHLQIKINNVTQY